ncbi:MAG: TIGR03118 family protein [Chloroflexi bacterium]|nr:MAG: TIGR03118 family protein [Chloroflexota bacterium]TMD65166.1 MAG: TIGR03118 family protein [Chloroflexota bacterium]
MGPRRILSIAVVLATGIGTGLTTVGAQAGVARGSYHQTNLVSDLPGAKFTDPHLKNPWGLSSSPSSPIWVSDNNAGVTTLYLGDGTAVKKQNGDQLAPTIPAPGGGPGGTPTGTVFNPTNDFVVSKAGKSGKSFFLFATEDGVIAGWNPTVDIDNAVLAKDNSTAVDSAGDVGAVYKGLALGSVQGANYLYAANFRFGTVDVFDKTFTQQPQAAFPFSDPNLPPGFAPFGIQNIGGQLFVTYALQNAEKHDDLKGPGNGFVDVFNTSGVLLRRFATRGSLNSPWGLVLAPSTFGNFHNDVLVGNFGDGRINAYTPSGTFRGQLKSETNAPIQISGLWGLRFGNGSNREDVNSLFFAAGINDEADGLFGTLQSVGD